MFWCKSMKVTSPCQGNGCCFSSDNMQIFLFFKVFSFSLRKTPSLFVPVCQRTLFWYPPARSGAGGSCFIHTETKIRPDCRSSSERNAKEIHIIKFTDSYWSHIRFYSFADQLVYRQPILRAPDIYSSTPYAYLRIYHSQMMYYLQHNALTYPFEP